MKLLKGKIVTELPLTGVVAGASYFVDKQDGSHFEHYVADDYLQLRKVLDVDTDTGVQLIGSGDSSVVVDTQDGGKTYDIRVVHPESVVRVHQGAGISIDNADPKNPVISTNLPGIRVEGEGAIQVTGGEEEGFLVKTTAVSNVEVEGGDIQARIEDGTLKLSVPPVLPVLPDLLDVTYFQQEGLETNATDVTKITFEEGSLQGTGGVDNTVSIGVNPEFVRKEETKTTFEVVSTEMSADGQTFDIQMKYVGESGEDQIGEIKVPVQKLPEHLARLTPEVITFIETLKGDYEGNIGNWTISR